MPGRHESPRYRAPLQSALLGAAAVLAVALPGARADDDIDARIRGFAAHVLALRQAAMEGADTEAVTRIPGSGPRERAAALWAPFFENASVLLGRLRSPAPTALFYNPLLDVALVTYWRQEEDGYRAAVLRALPGERLNDPRARAIPAVPAWATASDGPIDALAETTGFRLDAFRYTDPAEARKGWRLRTTFAADAAAGREVRSRLLDHAVRRAGWYSGKDAWLAPTLTAIQKALASDDPAAVIAAAPATDDATAEVIARMPVEYAEGLLLDEVLVAGDDGRLLFGSSPDDGDIYVIALCRLEGGICGLRRILFVSLTDWVQPDADASRTEGG